ncbi:hypothetical protein DL771_007685 [Monosporascus sp. 5C6A]|nr:hypothetical protein DL771_007685 [Monosporascus sp. 5C6A]
MQFTTILSSITLFAAAATAAPSTSSAAAQRRQTIDPTTLQQVISDITNVREQIRVQGAIVQNSLYSLLPTGGPIDEFLFQATHETLTGISTTSSGLDDLIRLLNQAAGADGQAPDLTQFE